MSLIPSTRLSFDELRHRLDEFGFVDLIGKLGDDDAVLAVSPPPRFPFSRDDYAAPAGAVSLTDTSSAHDKTAGRKVGRRHIFHKLVHRDVGVCR